MPGQVGANFGVQIKLGFLALPASLGMWEPGVGVGQCRGLPLRPWRVETLLSSTGGAQEGV